VDGAVDVERDQLVSHARSVNVSVLRLAASRRSQERPVKFSPRRILWMIVIPAVVVVLVLAIQNGP
jgi:hypothetical protein